MFCPDEIGPNSLSSGLESLGYGYFQQIKKDSEKYNEIKELPELKAGDIQIVLVNV